MAKGNQQGRVYEDRGKWFIDYFDPSGARIRRGTQWSNDAANKRKAERFLRGILDAIEDGNYVEADFFGGTPRDRRLSRTFEEQATIYVNGLDLKKSTLDAYRSRLKNTINPVIGSKQLRNITVSELRLDYLDICSESAPSTKLCLFTQIRAVFSLAVKDGIIEADKNPADDLVWNKPDEEPLKESDVFSAPMLGEVMAAANKATWPGFANLLRVMAYTGMRPGELCALRWEDVSLAGGYARVSGTRFKGETTAPKSKSGRRTVELNELAVDALRAQMQITMGKPDADGFVFTSFDEGKPWGSSSSLTRHWNKVLEVLPEEVPQLRLYALRHSYASICITAGVSLFWLSKQLGHSATSVTETVYARWLKGQDKGRQSAMFAAALADSGSMSAAKVAKAAGKTA